MVPGARLELDSIENDHSLTFIGKDDLRGALRFKIKFPKAVPAHLCSARIKHNFFLTIGMTDGVMKRRAYLRPVFRPSPEAAFIHADVGEDLVFATLGHVSLPGGLLAAVSGFLYLQGLLVASEGLTRGPFRPPGGRPYPEIGLVLALLAAFA